MQFVSNHLRYTNMVARKEKRGTSFSEGVCLRIFSGYLLDSRNTRQKEMRGTYQIQGMYVKKKVPEGTCVKPIPLSGDCG